MRKWYAAVLFFIALILPGRSGTEVAGKKSEATPVASLLSRFVSRISSEGSSGIRVWPMDRPAGWVVHDRRRQDASTYQTVSRGENYHVGPGDSKSLFVVGGGGTLTLSVTHQRPSSVMFVEGMSNTGLFVEIVVALHGNVRRFVVGIESGACFDVDRGVWEEFKLPFVQIREDGTHSRTFGTSIAVDRRQAENLHMQAEAQFRQYSSARILALLGGMFTENERAFDFGACEVKDGAGNAFWNVSVVDVARTGTNVWLRGIGKFDSLGNEKVFLYARDGRVELVLARTADRSLRCHEYGEGAKPLRSCARKGAETCYYENGDEEDGKRVFDASWCTGFIEEIDDKGKCLREVARKVLAKK